MVSRPSRVLVHVPARTRDYLEVLEPLAPVLGLEVRGASSSEVLGGSALEFDWPEVFLGAGLGPDLLLRLPRLGWAQWAWAGVDELTSAPAFLDALRRGQFRLTRAAGLFGRPIAEYVLAWCLFVTRNAPRVLAARARREWDRFEPATLAGRRLGVAGLGSVGAEIARLAAAVGLEVWGLRRHPDASPPGGLPLARIFGPVQLGDFVAGLDYLVLALPLTPETRGLFSRDILGRMRPGSVLINVGRGATLDEAGLVRALRDGRPAWAILDAFATEPLPPESELWSLPNVVVTPHHAGISRPAEVVALFRRNLERYRAGGPLEGEVRADLGY